MTKVFIGGSRKISRLGPEVEARVDNIIAGNYTVLIGDADGADKAVQAYLAERGFKKVVVYCMGDKCRNNVGGWEIQRIRAGKNVKGFEYYATKDRVMAQDASHGLMLWDGKSKGSLNNILNLIALGKSVLVYLHPIQEFVTIKTSADLDLLLSNCHPQTRETIAAVGSHPDSSKGI
jgi:hypothetical protein